MPWIGPDSTSARLRGAVFGAVFRAPGFAVVLRVDVFFRLAFFAGLAFFLLAFFADVFFFVAAVFLLGVFLPEALLLEAFLPAAFLREVFFFEGFAAVFFLLADFLREAGFLAVDFFAADFLRVTLVFFPDAFFRPGAFREVGFLRAAPAALRFLLACFFAGIVDSCRFEKNAALYMPGADMEA